MTKRPYEKQFLLDYSQEHLSYEIDMFFGILEMLSPTDTGATRLKNAKIESFVVHLRNLIVFLGEKSQYDTDV